MGAYALHHLGICFGPISRSQRELLDLARPGRRCADGLGPLRALSTRWTGLGTLATFAPVFAVAFMVLKPALPGCVRANLFARSLRSTKRGGYISCDPSIILDLEL